MPMLALLTFLQGVVKSWFVTAFVRCLAYQLGGIGISIGVCCERTFVEIRDITGEDCAKLRLSDQARHLKTCVDLCTHLNLPAALNLLTTVSVSHPWIHVLVTNSCIFSSSKYRVSFFFSLQQKLREWVT